MIPIILTAIVEDDRSRSETRVRINPAMIVSYGRNNTPHTVLALIDNTDMFVAESPETIDELLRGE